VNTSTSPEVEILVRFFGQAREAAGVGEGRYRVPQASTVGDVARHLASWHPALAPHLERCSFAVNESYVDRRARVHGGDEVAVLPPIGGG
jgi:molybdopterin converting factor subunit 1